MNSKEAASIVARRLSQRGYIKLMYDIAESFHVTVEGMLGNGKRRSNVVARHALWAAIYRDGRLSFTEMGALFGRDHTTILYGVHKHLDAAIAKPSVNDDNGSAQEKVA